MKRGKRKYGQVPQKLLGKRKVEIPFGYFIGGHCVCACTCVCTCVHVCAHACVCTCVCMCKHSVNFQHIKQIYCICKKLISSCDYNVTKGGVTH